MLDYGKPVRIQRKSWKSLKVFLFFWLYFFVKYQNTLQKKRLFGLLTLYFFNAAFIFPVFKNKNFCLL